MNTNIGDIVGRLRHVIEQGYDEDGTYQDALEEIERLRAAATEQPEGAVAQLTRNITGGIEIMLRPNVAHLVLSTPCLLYPASALEARDAEIARLKTFVRDTCDEMECPPSCDSRGHDDLCPVAHPLEAWRALRERVKELESDAARYRWLRDAPATQESEPIRNWLWTRPFGADMGCLDAAIDKAMQEGKS